MDIEDAGESLDSIQEEDSIVGDDVDDDAIEMDSPLEEAMSNENALEEAMTDENALEEAMTDVNALEEDASINDSSEEITDVTEMEDELTQVSASMAPDVSENVADISTMAPGEDTEDAMIDDVQPEESNMMATQDEFPTCSKFLQCSDKRSKLPTCSFRSEEPASYIDGVWQKVKPDFRKATTDAGALDSFAYNYQPSCNKGPFRCHIAEPNSCGPKSLQMLQYHWTPNSCRLMDFVPAELERMWAGKYVLFVGDSLMRQMFNSIRFLMRDHWMSAEQALRKDPEFFDTKSRARIEFVWSKYLLDEHALPGRLVLPQRSWPDMVKKADWVIMNVGHHWHKKDRSFENYEAMVNMVTDTMQTNFKGSLFVFRTSAPGYYGCETMEEPVDTPQELTPDIDLYDWRKPIQAELMWEQKARERSLDSFRWLNVSFSAYRADAHVGYKIRDGQNKLDCLHWCMPGVPDYWNYLLYNLFATELS